MEKKELENLIKENFKDTALRIHELDNEDRNSLLAEYREWIMKDLNFEEIMMLPYEAYTNNLNKFVLKKDSLNQVDGFLGAGLPENINLWSKAGLMSEVRHDSAWWTDSQSLHTLVVVFCNGEKYSKDTSLLPLIAKEVYEHNKRYTLKD